MSINIIKIEDMEFIFDTTTDRGCWLFDDLINNKIAKFRFSNGQVIGGLKEERGVTLVVDSFEKDWIREDYTFMCHLKYPLSDIDLLNRYFKYSNL
jgi:hypothetical protein